MLRVHHVLADAVDGFVIGNSLLAHVNLEARPYAAGMQAQAVEPSGRIATLDLVGHVDVGRLALAVGRVRLVRALLQVEIAKVYARATMARRREHDDAGVEGWAGRGQHRRLDQVE